ncbi:hypothetical protein J7K50_05635 [bacterium]|nr:hypothetical protein [bacterium]
MRENEYKRFLFFPLTARVVLVFIAIAVFVLLTVEIGAESASGRYHLECERLRIEKGDELTVISLSGGVTLASRDGMRITAESGVIKVVSRLLDDGLNGKQILGRDGEAGDDVDGETRAGESGAPRINPDDLKYIELSGDVVMTGVEGSLTCDAIFSDDGGRSWRTQGRADFTGLAKNTGKKFSANSLYFNSDRAMLEGAGGVQIILPPTKGIAGADADDAKGSKQPVSVSAGGFTFDIEGRVLVLTGKPTVTRGGARFAANRITYYGESGRIDAVGAVEAKFPDKNVTVRSDSVRYGVNGKARFSGNVKVKQTHRTNSLVCDELEYVLETGEITARGAVRLEIPDEEIVLTADEVSGNLGEERGKATGNPVLTRGTNLARGDEIRFWRETDKIVVEVLGKDKTEYVIDPRVFEQESTE